MMCSGLSVLNAFKNLFKNYFLATPCSMRGSLVPNQELNLCSGSRVSTTGLPGKSVNTFLTCDIFGLQWIHGGLSWQIIISWGKSIYVKCKFFPHHRTLWYCSMSMNIILQATESYQSLFLNVIESYQNLIS